MLFFLLNLNCLFSFFFPDSIAWRGDRQNWVQSLGPKTWVLYFLGQKRKQYQNRKSTLASFVTSRDCTKSKQKKYQTVLCSSRACFEDRSGLWKFALLFGPSNPHVTFELKKSALCLSVGLLPTTIATWTVV